MSDADKIYSRYTTWRDKETIVRSFKYKWAFINIFDKGRPIIMIDLIVDPNTTLQFITAAAKYLMVSYSGVDVEPVIKVNTCGPRTIKIDYVPEMNCRNFWKVDDVIEEAEHFVRVIDHLYEVFNAGILQEQSKKEKENMPTNNENKYFDYTAIPTGWSFTAIGRIFPNIEKVIYNNPATVVFWKDHTKTVVKCQGEDSYDPQKGFMLCILKKLMGNQGNYNNFIKKWCPEDIFETMSIRDANGVKFTQMTITDGE